MLGNVMVVLMFSPVETVCCQIYISGLRFPGVKVEEH